MITSAAMGEKGIVDKGAFFVSDGRIVDVGKYSLLKKKYPKAVIKGNGRQLLMPGFIDAHSHGWGLSLIQQGILYDFLEIALLEWPAMIQIDPKLRALMSAIRHIRNGCTTMHHNYSALEDLDQKNIEQAIKGYEQAGIRLAFSLGGRDINAIALDDEAFYKTLPSDLQNFTRPMVFNDKKAFRKRYFEIFKNLYDHYNKKGMRILLGPSWVQGSTDEFLLEVKSRADSLGKIPIHIHALQTPIQKAYGLRKYGKSLVDHLNDLGLLDKNLVLGHAVYLSESDIKLLALNKVSITHHPSSNLAMRNGIAPIYYLHKEGVNVALGIDDKGINDDEDAIMELRMIHKLHRTSSMDLENTPALNAFDILRMGTINAAQVCGFEGHIGELKTGMWADAILVDLEEITEDPWISPDINIAEAFIHRAKGSHVNTSIIDGRIVMEDRKFLTLDVEAIYKEVRKQVTQGMSPKQQSFVKYMMNIKPYYLKWYKSWTEMDYDPFYVINSRK